MNRTPSRPLIAAMQVSIDGYALGPMPNRWTPGQTPSSSCHPSTPSSSAAGCSRIRDILGRRPRRPRHRGGRARQGPLPPGDRLRAARRRDAAPCCLVDASGDDLADRADRPRHGRDRGPAEPAGQRRLRRRRPDPDRRPDHGRTGRRAAPDTPPGRNRRRAADLEGPSHHPFELVAVETMASGRVQLTYRP